MSNQTQVTVVSRDACGLLPFDHFILLLPFFDYFTVC